MPAPQPARILERKDTHDTTPGADRWTARHPKSEPPCSNRSVSRLVTTYCQHAAPSDRLIGYLLTWHPHCSSLHSSYQPSYDHTMADHLWCAE